MSINIQIANKMKKVKWLLAAAVVATVAACQSDAVLRDVVSPPTDSPKAIGFSSYSEKSTRGDVDNPLFLEYYHSTFTVYASKKSTVDNVISEVFDGGATALVTFSNNATTPNEWTYSPYRYWDKQANYKFIAVAPNANIVKYDWNAAAENLVEVGTAANDFVTVAAGYTLVGQNLQKTATAAEIVKGFTGGADDKDTDIMTSALKSESGATHTANTDVVLDFKHILAKLNVNVAKASVLNDAEVYVKSLVISGLNDKGTYDESAYSPGSPFVAGDPTADPPTEDQPAVPATSGWTASYSDAAPHAYKLSYTYATDGNNYDNQGNDPEGQVGAKLADATSATVTVPTYFIESLVMPQAVGEGKATLTLKYQIVSGSHKEDYTYQMDMNAAFASYLDRHNYTLKLTIKPDVITFDAKAALWADGGTQPLTIGYE